MQHPIKLLLSLSLLTFVNAHGAIYGDHVFGSSSGGISSNPLTRSQSVNQWFFRGLTPNSAESSITLTPGGSVRMNVACSQDAANQGRMCNDGGGSLHLIPNTGKGSGCALLISYKSFSSIKPDDMTVFSVLHDCPKMDSNRVFAIPSNLPAGEATCAFHWVPPEEASADEQYMNGFRCTVAGKNKGTLTPAGNQKPLYWAAQGVSQPSRRPQYDEITDGAQKLVVSGGSASSDSGVDVGVDVGSGSGSGTNPSSGRPINPKKTVRPADPSHSSCTHPEPVVRPKCSSNSRRAKRNAHRKRALTILRRRLREEVRALGLEDGSLL